MSLFNESFYSLYLLHLGCHEKGRRRLQSTQRYSLSTKQNQCQWLRPICRLDAKQISLDDPVDSKETLANLRKLLQKQEPQMMNFTKGNRNFMKEILTSCN